MRFLTKYRGFLVNVDTYKTKDIKLCKKKCWREFKSYRKINNEKKLSFDKKT